MKSDFNEFKNFIKGKNTAVVGIGVSNTPLIYYLLKLGAKVSAFDKKTEGQLGDVCSYLKSMGVKLILGDNYLDNLVKFDVIFKTPSMRNDSFALINAKNNGAYITSEMEEFIRYCPAKIFGVTGSDGKTTTTTLIYNMLKEEGYKCFVGGNIGNPLFTRIEEIDKMDKVVLELSSFQLMTIDISPEVAIVTNISPNHLDIHKDMEEYINAKKNIYRYQNKGDTLILNKENAATYEMRKEAIGKIVYFSSKVANDNSAYYSSGELFIDNKQVCARSEMKILGIHNVEDLLAAFCAVKDDVSIESMRKVATSFEGVEHRCEFVREMDGVKYYNDSIGSSPTRTLAGLMAFEKPVILIAGGYDKKIPFEVLAEQGYKKVKILILLGATKEKIKEVFENVIKRNNLNLPIVVVESLQEAVYKAKEMARSGDIVTLSPACASFDMFPNFEDRGNKFKEIVNML